MTRNPSSGNKSHRPRRAAKPVSKPGSLKIASYLARAGVASRRSAEQLVLLGRVEVNGVIMQNVAQRVNPDTDNVRVDGNTVTIPVRHIYLMMHKPKGYITTASDEQERLKVTDLLPKLPRRVFPVGRLDTDTVGLLLFTSDGEWANRIAHPSSEVKKTYLVHIRGTLSDRERGAIKEGMSLDGGYTAPASISMLGESPGGSVYELIIHEGKRRQIRRMFAHLGHAVRELKRVAIGKLELGELKPGACRPLTSHEVENVWE